METIIGLLFILLPVIFKLIGKKFEQSGQTDKAGKFKKIAETLNGDDEVETPIYDWLKDISVETPARSVEDPDTSVEVPSTSVSVVIPTAVEPQVPSEPAQRIVKARKPLMEEETPGKKREKIDPKKLVIYSEIMKPKY